MQKRSGLAACGLLLMATIGLAGDWPSWRGPTASGIAAPDANPPIKWDAKTNIKWKASLPGRGSATPIVWKDQVFVLTASKTDRVAKPEELPKVDPKFQTKTEPPKHFYRFEVHSFDLKTGQKKWSKVANEAVPHEGHHETHSYAAGSPATDGQRLYVSFGSFGVYAYTLEGELLWKRDLGRINSRLGWGESVTPVLHGNTVILNWDQEGAGDSKLIVLDATTGKTRWEKVRDEKTSWNAPCVVDHAGRTQVIVNATNKVRSYDLANGDSIWEAKGMTVNAIPSVLTANGTAYVMSGYRGAAAMAVSLDSQGDVSDSTQVKWRYAKGTPYVPSPLLLDGRLYFTATNTGVLTILNAQTGKPILADERLPGLNQLYASPLAASGRLYLVDRNGTCVVLQAGDKPEILAVNKLDETIDASPVAVGKVLLLRGHATLFAIEEAQ